MRRIDRRLVQLSTAVALMCPAALGGNFQSVVMHVDDDAPPGGDGSSWTTAFRSLQDALNTPATSPAGPVYLVEVRIAGGRYVTPGEGSPGPFTIDQESPLVFGQRHGLHYRLLGGFNGLAPGQDDERDPQAYPTVLDGDINGDDGPGFEHYGDNAPGLVRVVDGAVVLELDGLLLRGATDSGFSSAVEYDLGETTSGLTMSFIARNCTFTENRSSSRLFQGPSASYPEFVSVELSDCTVSDNAVAAESGTLLDSKERRDWFHTVSRCVFERNTSGNGIYDGSNLNIRLSVIAENHATTDGAGTVSLFEAGSVSGCLFVGNSASHGGAVRVYGRTDDIEIGSVTAAGNSAAFGAALYFDTVTNLSRPVTVWNSVLSGNSASQSGDNISLQEGGPYVVVSNTILDGGEDSIEQSTSGGTSMLFGSLVLDADPRFERPIGPGMGWRDADYRLARGSPAVDAGNTLAHSGSGPDLGGMPRVIDAIEYEDLGIGGQHNPAVIDMGCYEAPADLLAGCPGDLAPPWGVRDLADIVGFVTAFDAHQPAADLAPPVGVFDLADVTVFVTGFAAVCD